MLISLVQARASAVPRFVRSCTDAVSCHVACEVTARAVQSVESKKSGEARLASSQCLRTASSQECEVRLA